MNARLLEAVPLLMDLIGDIEQGRATDAFAVSRKLAALAVDIIPVDALKDSLSEQDRNWADASVDIAEAIKVNAAADAAELAKVVP